MAIMAETLATEFQIQKCCRLCAKEQEVTLLLFDEEANKMLLKEKLSKYLLIEIQENDSLPKHICIECCSKLERLCEFVKNVRKAQETLQNNSVLRQVDGIKIETKEVPIEFVMKGAEPDEIATLKLIKIEKEDEKEEYEDTTSIIEAACLEKCKKMSSKPFYCSICRRGFVTDLALKNHSWVHKDSKTPLTCRICMSSFTLKCDLIRHLKEHKTSGICQICGRKFRSERTYAAHMSVHLSATVPHTCKVCGRSYGSWASLKAHSVTHSDDRPFSCHLCSKSFKRHQELRFHINQHTGERPYKCTHCNKAFASSGNCYSHRMRMHPEQVIKKNIVARKLKQPPSHLIPPYITKSTMVNVNGIFKYQCQVCRHTFVMRENFMYHMYQHTGQKMFHCTVCTAQFITKKGLHLHYIKLHPNMDPPPLLSKMVITPSFSSNSNL